MKEKIKYRNANESDAETVYLLDTIRYEKIKKKPLSLTYIKDCIRHYRESFVVALHNDKVVGFCIGIGSKTSELGWISAATVSEDYGGRNIGRNLINSVCNELNAIGCIAVSLTSEPNLVTYYEKLGFIRITDELKDYYGMGENRFIFRKTF